MKMREEEEEEKEYAGPSDAQLACKSELETQMTNFKQKFSDINYEISDAKDEVEQARTRLYDAEMRLEVKNDKKRRANEKYKEI